MVENDPLPVVVRGGGLFLATRSNVGLRPRAQPRIKAYQKYTRNNSRYFVGNCIYIYVGDCEFNKRG